MTDDAERAGWDVGPRWPDPQAVTGNQLTGYPCPKDETVLTLVDGGAWCKTCHTVWRELDEVSLRDIDELPQADEGSYE